jgi:hypothetical protein
MKNIIKFVSEKMDISDYDNIILENGQGLLLSTTGRNNYTTSTITNSYIDHYIVKNEFNQGFKSSLCINYVTRTYETRHGDDKYIDTNEFQIDNNDETNIYNKFQGEFRSSNKFINLNNLSKRILGDNTYSIGTKEYSHKDHAIYITHGQKTFDGMTFSQYYHDYMHKLNRKEIDDAKVAFRNMYISDDRYGNFNEFC